MPGPNETRIVLHALAQLWLFRDDLATFWRCNTGAGELIDRKRGKTSRFVQFGEPGQHDIQGCVLGHWFGFEMKKPGEKRTKDQDAFHLRMYICGGQSHLCFDGFAPAERVHLFLDHKGISKEGRLDAARVEQWCAAQGRSR